VAGIMPRRDGPGARSQQTRHSGRKQTLDGPEARCCQFWQTVDDAVRDFIPLARQRRPLRWFQRSWDVAVPGHCLLRVRPDGAWKLVHAVGGIQATSKSFDVSVPNKDGYAIHLCLKRYLV
jgi:hypothetical protein